MTNDDFSAAVDAMTDEFQAVSETFGAARIADPHAMYRRFRQETPVLPRDIVAELGAPSQADYARRGRPVVTLFRHADVMAVLRDPETWRSELLLDGLGAFTEGILLTGMDGAPHRKIRAMLQPVFTLPVMRGWNETLVRPLIRGDIAALRPAGRADLVRDFTLPFPVRAIYAILGFRNDPEEIMRFAGWALTILAGTQPDPAKADKARAAAHEAAAQLRVHVRALVAKRRAEGVRGDDLIAHLLRAESEGERFSDDEIAGLVRTLLLAASETTTRTLSNALVQLLERPALMARLRADRTLIGRFVTESMRVEPVAAFLARLASRDTEIGGVPIARGTAVALCVASANRDPGVHDDPDTLDIDRPLRPVISFGFGVHMCLGMHIARVEIESALDALLDLPGLRRDPARPAPEIRGLQMRGPEAIPVIWDA